MPKHDRGFIRQHEPVVAILQRWIDLLVICAGFALAVWWQAGRFEPEQWIFLLLAMFIFYMVNDFNNLYGSWRGDHSLRELGTVTGNWAVSFLGLFVVRHFFINNARLDDAAMLIWFASALVLLCGYRWVLRLLLRHLRSHGYNSRSVAIAGSGPLGQRLARTIAAAPWMGLRVTAFYDDKSDQPVLIDGQQIPCNGTMQKLVEDARDGVIDKIYITLPMRAEEKIKWMLDALSDSTASVYLIPDVFVFDLLHARNETINGIPSISIFDTPMNGTNRVIKRIEDIVLAILILCLISLPMLFIALSVRMTSPGPALFKQKRYGIDGKPIEVWKFRSMKVMENGGKVIQARKDDDRITPFGAFLRRTSLDELPQFINVLRGEMSIVGPRPHAVAHNEEYRKLINGYMLRHKVKPGITGWAQINGWRGETDTLDKMEKRIEYDLDYIRNWSLWLDLKIVFLTVFKGFVNKNAY